MKSNVSKDLVCPCCCNSVPSLVSHHWGKWIRYSILICYSCNNSLARVFGREYPVKFSDQAKGLRDYYPNLTWKSFDSEIDEKVDAETYSSYEERIRFRSTKAYQEALRESQLKK